MPRAPFEPAAVEEVSADEARRHGIHWAEVSIAAYIRERAAAVDGVEGVDPAALLRDIADTVGAAKWARAPMQSVVDLEEIG